MSYRLPALSSWLPITARAAILMAGIVTTLGQGTVTFNAHPYFAGTNYTESGIWFQVVIPSGSAYDDMGIAPAIA